MRALEAEKYISTSENVSGIGYENTHPSPAHTVTAKSGYLVGARGRGVLEMAAESVDRTGMNGRV